jgi:RNA-binding protein
LTEAYESELALGGTTEVGEIGEVLHLAKSGRLIVKLSGAGTGIRPGEMLVDAAGRRVGKISELIGPVSAPYASVIPMTDRTARLVGTKVFAGGPARPQGQRRDKGRRQR